MKTLPNSLKRLLEPVAFTNAETSVNLVNVVADDGGALRRTKIIGMSAVCTGLSAVQGNLTVPMIALLSVKDFMSITGEHTFNDFLELSILSIAVDVGRVPDNTGITFTASGGGIFNSEIITPLNDYGRLACGTDFFLVVDGGSFLGNMIVTIITERVEITQDEYMKYYAGTC